MVPGPGSGTASRLTGVAALAPDDAWAVGSFSDTTGVQTLTIHWDGTAVPDPSAGPLAAVAARDTTDAWAVGSVNDGSADRMLIEHCTGACPAATATPTAPTATAGPPSPTATAGGPTATPPGPVTAPSATPPGPTGTPILPNATPAPVTTATPRATACVPAFRDVQPADYFYTPVRALACRGVVNGYADGTFRPGADVTRGQLAKIVVTAQGWPLDTSGGPHFADVPPAAPFYPYIETAYGPGIVAGYGDGTFRPGNPATRGQIAKIGDGAMLCSGGY